MAPTNAVLLDEYPVQIINCAKYFADRLKIVCSVEIESLMFPCERRVVLTTVHITTVHFVKMNLPYRRVVEVLESTALF